MNISQEQVKLAANTGLNLLGDPTLRVPLPLALSGQLNLLQGILVAIAEGQLVVIPPPPPPEKTQETEKHE